MGNNGTICAISTPPGNGAIAMIRVSGPGTYDIAGKVLRFAGDRKPADFASNSVHLGEIFDQEQMIDEVMVSFYRSPASYTGEDMIEISCHGAVYIQKRILELLIDTGARMARPGEFTQRAFLNGKLDLAQAEAVASLIAAGSAAAHRLAVNQMRGVFSNEISRLRQKLLHFSSLIELELDFGEEDVEFADRQELGALIDEIRHMVEKLLRSFILGNVIKNGVPVAIAGKPNVGKSTLLNELLHEERAIVSEIAGTTRDVIEDVISIDGIHFRFIDTAGLSKGRDQIESLGVEKAFEKIRTAYVVLYMIDAENDIPEIGRLISLIKSKIRDQDKKLIILFNKIDLLPEKEVAEKSRTGNYPDLGPEDHLLPISAFRKINMNKLTDLLVQCIFAGREGEHEVIVTNARHYEALQEAHRAILRIVQGLEERIPEDLMAQDIRDVLNALGEITGEVTTDEILNHIFENFCIGK